AEAVRLFRAAAEQGNVGAQVNLGVMLQAGRGAPQDYEEAVRWYRRAAEWGHPFAQYDLAEMYAAGTGVSQDRLTAHMWYTGAISRLSGDGSSVAMRAQALRARALVGERMSPAELAEAARLAQAWKPRQ